MIACQELPPVALYVHVPFCVSHCPYCDFVVLAGAAARGPRNRIDSFLAAVETELHLRADELDRRWPDRSPLRSLYLGGGTPSLLPAQAFARLIGIGRDRFGLETDAEVTVEVNPGPDERGDAATLRSAGVTRLSIGAQSLDDVLLARLGRRHAASDVEAAIRHARDAGIASVSLDLLYDVPGQSLHGWRRDLDAAISLEPDHLSLYALTLDDPDADGLTGSSGDHLPVSAGARRWRDRARPRQDEDRAAAMYELATERLAAAGYHGYEISNWARAGHESRHNRAYWRREPFEAVGPGAHAFDGASRRWTAARLDGYLAALLPADGRAAALPPGAHEPVDGPAAAAERQILGLRLAEGLGPIEAQDAPLGPHLSWGRTAGLLADRLDGRVVLTTRGRLLSNELFARLV